jgi:hypothetical protein
MSVARILAQSSNVGAITLAEKLGPTRLYRWMRRFGFGRTTGVGFPARARASSAARRVVGLDDRQRADRPGRRRHAGADGGGLRVDREPRRLGAAAPRRAHRGQALRVPQSAASSRGGSPPS